MLLPEFLNLGKSFKKYFEIVPALSETLRNEAYRVRYQVYCKELRYESIQRPDQLEIDEYDSHALHLLIRDIQTNEFIGCTRIICAQSGNSAHTLPFERICAKSLDRSIVDPTRLPRHSIAEVSRLAVIARYRRRRGDSDKPINISEEDYGTLDRPRFPYIPIGLYIGTIELARLNGIEHIFMLTESRLSSHFNKLGADIRIIGDPVEFHGQRVPSVLNINQVIKDMRLIFRPLYQMIAIDVKRHISE